MHPNGISKNSRLHSARSTCFASPIPLATTSYTASQLPCVQDRKRNPLTIRHRRSHNAAKIDVRADANGNSEANVDINTSASTSTSVKTSDDSFNWYNKWYAVAYEDDVDSNEMFKFQLFDRNYILVHDKCSNTYTALDDICPHRTVPLSEGRLFVQDSQPIIECRYHGWKFSGCDGKCMNIPVSSKTPPKSANIRGVYKVEKSPFGVLFVYIGDEQKMPPLPLPERLSNIHSGLDTSVGEPYYFHKSFRIFPFPFDYILENLSDPHHVPWSHHKTDGDRRKVTPNTHGSGIEMISADNEKGNFDSLFKVALGDDSKRELKLFVNVQPPQIFFKGFGSKDDGSDSRFYFLLYTVPIGKEKSALFSIRAFLNPPLVLKLINTLKPKWMSHAHSNVVLDGDSPLLQMQYAILKQKEHEYGNKKVGWRFNYLLSETKWDNLVIAFRKWFDKYGPLVPYYNGDATGNGAIPRLLTAKEVNDRYEYHTKHCQSCTAALNRFRFIENMTDLLIPGLAILMGTLGLVTTNTVRKSWSKLGWTGMVVWIFLVVLRAVAKRCIASLTYTDTARRLAVRDDTFF